MKTFDDLTDDFSRVQVPDSATVSGLKIAIVLVGAIITLPVFLIGAQLGYGLGLYNAFLVFFVAGLFLSILAAGAGILAAKTRLTTWIIIQYSFGKTGAKIVSSIIGITVLGWYGATVDMFARASEVIMTDLGISSVSHYMYVIVASTMMVAIALFGFKGLDKLSKLAVPIMLGLLALLIWSAMRAFDIPLDWSATMGVSEGISACIGGFIVAVTMFPDICRYAGKPKDAVIASSLSFGVGIPVILLLAAVPVLATKEQDFLKVIMLVGIGIPGLLLLLLATWTTNAYNLYSSSLVFASVTERISKWKLVIIVGIVGTLIALLPILDNFLHFLHFLAILIPPVAGVYLADFYLLHKQNYDYDLLESLPEFKPLAFVAWIIGGAGGYLTNENIITLTTVPALDSLGIGFVTYLTLNRFSLNVEQE